MTLDLRLGRWQDVLADVGQVDALICDPPYGARTHAGNQDMAEKFDLEGSACRRSLTYGCWAPADVAEFVAAWATRVKSWIVCVTSHDLIPAWEDAYNAAGRYSFAPVPCIYHRPRMAADGPASCTVHLMVSRPREKRFLGWGSLPGWYGPIMAPRQTDPDHHIGGKPLDLMRAIVRDYSRPDNLVCDPCAGGATTLLASVTEGRRAVGSECDPETYAKAQARIAKGWTPPLFGHEAKRQKDSILL